MVARTRLLLPVLLASLVATEALAVTYTPRPPTLGDLSVQSASAASMTLGRTKLTVTLSHSGPSTSCIAASATAFKMTLSNQGCYNGIWQPKVGENYPATATPFCGGSTRTFVKEILPTGSLNNETIKNCGGNWIVQVDPDQALAESNENNNSYSFPNQ